MPMLVNSKSAHRFRFNCPCCDTESGTDRKKERRTIKRRERQNWKNQVRQHLTR